MINKTINLFLIFTCISTGLLRADLVRFEITERSSFAEGKNFGDVGAYEKIVGKVHYELDPELPQNQNVIDLKLAVRNDRGLVEFSSDLYILAPKNLAKGNGSLLYDVNNRGNKLALRHFNQSDDGFLMGHGFTIVSSGWDGELLPNDNKLRLSPPIVKTTGKPITGLVRCEMVPSSSSSRTVVNWANHGSYRPTASGLKNATLTHRLLASHPRVPIPRNNWDLIVTEVKNASPGQLPKVELEYPAGFQKAHIYELIYEAQDPVVMGTGFTAVRDLVSALRHGTGTDNPLLVEGKSELRRAIGFGVSQSGRFLREFVYWDFNQDEKGHKVFDGIIPHVSGSGMGSFNHRFAQPTRHAGQHDHHDYPPDRFPFAYETQDDPISGQKDGILRRALESKTAPLVFHTQSSSEYWNRSGSLVHTDPLGKKDGKIPENVRIYFFGGTQHGPSSFPPKMGDGQTLPNPATYKNFMRALLLAMDRWCQSTQAPPKSVYPKIKDGDLVAWTQNATGFPSIPGIRYPQIIHQPSYLDFGPRWQRERIIDFQPPIARGDYQVLAPRSGPDGNEIGCLSPPEVAVPVATYTSWQLRKEDAGATNQLRSLTGSYIPFPTTKTERDKTNDPRLSLQERYGNLENYINQLESVCADYEKSGYLLEEDLEEIIQKQRERVTPLFKQIPIAKIKLDKTPTQ